MEALGDVWAQDRAKMSAADVDKNVKLWEDIVQLRREAGGEGAALGVARALTKLADFAPEQERGQLYDSALAALREQGESLDKAQEAGVLFRRAVSIRVDGLLGGDWLTDEAVRALAEKERLLGEAMRVLPSEDPVSISCLKHLAQVRVWQRKMMAAEPVWREVLEKERRQYGAGHQEVTQTMVRLSETLAELGVTAAEESHRLVEQALQVERARVGGDQTFADDLEKRLEALAARAQADEKSAGVLARMLGPEGDALTELDFNLDKEKLSRSTANPGPRLGAKDVALVVQAVQRTGAFSEVKVVKLEGNNEFYEGIAAFMHALRSPLSLPSLEDLYFSFSDLDIDGMEALALAVAGRARRAAEASEPNSLLLQAREGPGCGDSGRRSRPPWNLP
jgi:hypothetical protein